LFVLRKLAESVASHKSCQQRKAKVERCGCSRCNRGLAGSPRVPLRFQLALRAPEGRCSDLTRPFFADSHWEAEPYQRLFLQQTRSSFPRREVSGHVTGRLSVPNQSSFGELRMGPTLRDTLDNGLCCSSQGRGHVQSFENYSNVEVMPTTANYNLPHRTGRLS